MNDPWSGALDDDDTEPVYTQDSVVSAVSLRVWLAEKYLLEFNPVSVKNLETTLLQKYFTEYIIDQLYENNDYAIELSRLKGITIALVHRIIYDIPLGSDADIYAELYIKFLRASIEERKRNDHLEEVRVLFRKNAKEPTTYDLSLHRIFHAKILELWNIFGVSGSSV